MLRNHFRKLTYLTVVVWSCAAIAGSYDDFFSALRIDNASALSELLQRGFDPNTRDPKGQPGLTVALQSGSPKVASLLIAQTGIDVNALNAAGESPLMMAALKGDLADTHLLLTHGAKVNLPGWSPLHYAATGPAPQIVALLLDRGADINAGSPNGTTPLMMAAQYGSEDSVDLLLARGADPKRRNDKGLQAVDFARMSGREPLVKRLSAGGAR
jgi:ankyrin repeat protein